MKIMSWNVNGIRAAAKKGFLEFVEREEPDILAVQETKAEPGQCEPRILTPNGMKGYWSAAVRKGYSGVATFCKTEPRSIQTGIGVTEYDSEGRFVITEHSGFTLYNIYFVNGGSGAERHDFKQKFLRDLSAHLQKRLQAGDKLVIAGDYNVAHRDIDVYNPAKLATVSGFLPEEREWMEAFLKMGFVDTFRLLHPNDTERFTWWSQIERARLGNRGWRIDYLCVSQNLATSVRRAEILDEQMGSDHCPCLLELDGE